MRALFLLLGLCLPFACVAVSAPESPEVARAKAFTTLYQAYCFRYIHDPDGLKTELARAQATPRPALHSSGVLQGATGQVWLLRNPLGIFFVALLDDGTCRTVAEAADNHEAEFLFRAFTDKAPPPLRAQHVHYEVRRAGAGAKVRSIGVEWHAEGSATYVHFQLDMTIAPQSHQAIVNIQQKKEPKPLFRPGPVKRGTTLPG